MTDSLLIDVLRPKAVEIRAADGAALFAPGDASDSYLVPLSGRVRVEQTALSGRTVVLYRIEAGEGCVMTTSCLLSGRDYSAWGYAEGDVTALALGANAFHDLLDRDATFRAAVLGALSDRLVELTGVIDDLLVARVDVKLARWLARTVGGAIPPVIETTHDRVAAEIGSVREVVSRLLKDFERRGWVLLGRGRIEVRDADALAHLSRSD